MQNKNQFHIYPYVCHTCKSILILIRIPVRVIRVKRRGSFARRRKKLEAICFCISVALQGRIYRGRLWSFWGLLGVFRIWWCRIVRRIIFLGISIVNLIYLLSWVGKILISTWLNCWPGRTGSCFMEARLRKLFPANSCMQLLSMLSAELHSD